MQLHLICLIIAAANAAKVPDIYDQERIINEVNSANALWKAGRNFAPDTTYSYLKGLLGVKEGGIKLPLRKEHELSDFLIPEEFDAREQWPNCPTIRQIRDQGTCGSCWAVAASSAFSDRMCIETNGTFTDPISEEELLSCCQSCGFGCQGGYTGAAWDFFLSNGVVTGGGYKSKIGCQPYEIQACEHHTNGSLPSCSSLPMSDTPSCQKKCTNPSYKTPFDQDHHTVKESYSLGGEKKIQKEILKSGPVEAAFNVYEDFPTYKSGVYHHVSGSILGGHAVRIIGWGVESGTPYWLVANSWNTNWGQDGLFKILRGKNECGFEQTITAGIPNVRNH